MRVEYRCPQCESTQRLDLAANSTRLKCPLCKSEIPIEPLPSDDEPRSDAGLDRCLVCHSTDLFIRKDFPQRLGILIVVVGFVASSVAWYYHEIWWTFGFLFATAAIDVVLFLVMGEALVCYRCHAHYRNLESLGDYHGFNLETHERYRQEAARTEAAERSSGTWQVSKDK